ncbi:oxidase assembly protein 1 [Diaporthe helianthi]|uniref:Oxidase assembly protein 1 n=1 Tax=Diaporthe helianthi TaxID=158607 RepID=A0A2P5I3R2_DIAHE|nr:oxidase assembly protein 1 [Diaporthe helianthi]
MIPSRGIARLSPGLSFQNQIFSKAPGRSLPRQARSVANTRQFGTTLTGNGNGKLFHGIHAASISSRTRIGTATMLSSHSILLASTRQARFASTGSGPSPAESAASSTSSSSTPSEFPADFSSLGDLDLGASLLNTPETIGYLHNLGLDYGWGPTAFSQWFVEHLHIWGGLPWWASIVGFAVLVRLVLAKPALVAQQESIKMNKLRKDPVFSSLQEKFMHAMAGAQNLTHAEMSQLRMQMNLVRERHGIKTWKTFIPMLQAPIAFGMFRLCTGMTSLPVPGLETAGTLWFTDLTVADPYMILPLRAIPYMNPQQASLMKVLPFILGPLGFVITYKMAAAVQLFFAATAILQYLQTTFFHIGWIRKAAGLPPLEDLKNNASGGPFPNPGGMQYQAPRTIRTTATETKSTTDNPIEAFKDAWSGLQNKMKQRKETNAQKTAQKTAADYEKKRIQQEHEQFLKRREAARRKQTRR